MLIYSLGEIANQIFCFLSLKESLVTTDETGLSQDSVVNVSQVITVDKSLWRTSHNRSATFRRGDLIEKLQQIEIH